MDFVLNKFLDDGRPVTDTMLRLWKQLDYGQRGLVLSAILAAVIWLCPPWTTGGYDIIGFAPGTWGLAAYRARWQYVSPLWGVLSLLIIYVGVAIYDDCCVRNGRFVRGPIAGVWLPLIALLLMPVWERGYADTFSGYANYPLFFDPHITNLFIGPLFRAGYLIEDGQAPGMVISCEETAKELRFFVLPMTAILIKRRLFDISRANKRRQSQG